MKRLLLGPAALLVALLATLVPTSAYAITEASYSLSYCDTGGTFEGTGSNSLSNGTLDFGWCSKSGGMRTLTIKYDKYAGSDITIRFGYEWVNSNGGAATNRHWDQTSTAQTVKAGETWSARFHRDPPEAAPALAPCLRGLMLVNGSTVYSTYVVCR